MKTTNQIILKFNEPYFKKGEIIEASNNVKLKVVKVYKFNLWRRLLHFLDFKFKMFNCIKVVEND